MYIFPSHPALVWLAQEDITNYLREGCFMQLAGALLQLYICNKGYPPVPCVLSSAFSMVTGGHSLPSSLSSSFSPVSSESSSIAGGGVVCVLVIRSGERGT